MIDLLLHALCMVAPLAGLPQGAGKALDSESSLSEHAIIETEELKKWYDEEKPMVLLDARSEPYFDGRLLPNAMWLSYESSEEDIASAIPDRESHIVVYCGGIQCPASGWLYGKLQAMGYSNIYEYGEGIEKWVETGYPTIENQ